MRVAHKTVGWCEVEVQVECSAVDSFVMRGWLLTGDGRALTDDELNTLNEDCTDEIQAYAWENGSRDTD